MIYPFRKINEDFRVCLLSIRPGIKPFGADGFWGEQTRKGGSRR